MTKHDSVDRLMEQASEPVRTPETVLEEKITASEPPAPRGAVLPPKADELDPPAELFLPPIQSQALSATERGRHLLGALRPFLPAVGGALRLVDHGAAQAAARLLPLLGSLGSVPNLKQAAPPPPGTAQTAGFSVEIKTLAAEQARLTQELASHAATLAQQEENQRKLRDGISRLAAEENALENIVTRMRDRVGLLTATVVILALLVVAEGALLLLHR